MNVSREVSNAGARVGCVDHGEVPGHWAGHPPLLPWGSSSSNSGGETVIPAGGFRECVLSSGWVLGLVKRVIWVCLPLCVPDRCLFSSSTQSVLFVIVCYSQYRALLLVFNNNCVPLKHNRFIPAMLFFASWHCHPPLHCALTISLFCFFPPSSLYKTAYNVCQLSWYTKHI